jgi:serine/threonine-protein kinase
MTDPEQLLGTPLYISPEQCFDPRQVDGRADLFSLGIVLFENLTGAWPYTWTSKRELLRKVMKGELERHPATRRPEVPAWLDGIVARSLAFDREQRFANATDMRAALERGARPQRPSLLRRLLR